MVSDQQVRRLLSLMEKEKYFYMAADKAGMDIKTARKYRKAGMLPSQMRKEHNWKTRQDFFEGDWAEITEMLTVNPGLESKTLFQYLQRKSPEKYQEGQLRTLQRRIKQWRAMEGPAKEVFFSQIHHPGELCASDFTHMKSLGITIQNDPFDHLIYHCVLTYSNWEAFSICYSESFSSLSRGLQNALWKLGGVPKRHRSDRMSAAVNKECNPEQFTRSYQALMRHYKIAPERINARRANENGDVESSHKHFKSSVEQALMLRGSHNFNSLKEYEAFLQKIADQLNRGRWKRLQEELDVLKPLPSIRLDDFETREVRVTRGSTLSAAGNMYSVHSRLIGEKVRLKIYGDHIEVWYANKKQEHIPRLRGKNKHVINYRHIIDWLMRKPGAFENYRYKEDMFPSSWFRMAFDRFKLHMPLAAHKEYLRILLLAAQEGEAVVEDAIRNILEQDKAPTEAAIRPLVTKRQTMPKPTDVTVSLTEIASYDDLLEGVACHG